MVASGWEVVKYSMYVLGCFLVASWLLLGCLVYPGFSQGVMVGG